MRDLLFTFLISTENSSHHQLFTHARTAQRPANARQNHEAPSWCAPVRRTIPPARDAANIKGQVKPGSAEAEPELLPLPRPCALPRPLDSRPGIATSISPVSSFDKT